MILAPCCELVQRRTLIANDLYARDGQAAELPQPSMMCGCRPSSVNGQGERKSFGCRRFENAR